MNTQEWNTMRGRSSAAMRKSGWLDMSMQDFSGMNMSKINLNRVNLAGANLERAKLGWSKLVRTRLKGANLKGADLSFSNMDHADLRDCDLRDCDLSSANIHGVNLSGADLRGANIDYSCWPMWCGSLGVRVDGRLAAQFAYHFCSLICDDEKVKAAQSAARKLANEFHCSVVQRIQTANGIPPARERLDVSPHSRSAALEYMGF